MFKGGNSASPLPVLKVPNFCICVGRGLKTLGNSSILPFSGNGGAYSESKYSGNAGQAGLTASTALARVALWAGEGHPGQGAITDILDNCPLRDSGLGSHTFFFLYLQISPRGGGKATL